MLEAEETVIVLVHDAWHAAWMWDEVIARLDERGWASIALDLPGHGTRYQDETKSGSYSLAGYAQALVDYVQELARLNPFKNLVIAAHGMAGAVLQYAAPTLAQTEQPKLAGLIFIGGYILRDGERIIDAMPPEMAEVLQNLAQARSDGRVSMLDLPEYWRYNVINDGIRRADEILERLNPEPFAPLVEKAHGLDAGFFSLDVPLAYMSFNDDLSLPPGAFHPGMTGKLGQHRRFAVNAGHEAPLTKPREVADSLIFLTASLKS